MSDEDFKERMKKLKTGAPPPEDPAERDQLIVLASRVEAASIDLLHAHKNGEQAHRERLAELEHIFNGRHEKLLARVKDAFASAEQLQANSFKQWGQRLTELESTNRLLSKFILFLALGWMVFFLWEFLQ